jgi:hypothetical protein
MLTVRALSDIGSQNTGSLRTEQNRGISGECDTGQVRGVRGVQEGVQITSLEEMAIYSK